MFETMPKNIFGAVGQESMQYMVQRYFGAVHGWSIKGFDQASRQSRNATEQAEGGALAAVKVLVEKLPTYANATGNERGLRGFRLQDVVTLVAVLEHLIFDESTEMLEDAYRLVSLDPNVPLTRAKLRLVAFTYMLIYGFMADRRDKEGIRQVYQQIADMYPKGWPP